MNLLDRVLNKKTSRLFTVLFFCLGAVYPLIVEMDLLLFGEKSEAIKIGDTYEDYVVSSKYGDYIERAIYGVLEFGYNGEVYRVRTERDDKDLNGSNYLVYHSSDSPAEEYVIWFFYGLYSYQRIWMILTGFFVYGLVLLAGRDSKRTINEKKLRYESRSTKIIKVGTIMIMLIPAITYVIGGYEYFKHVVMIWGILPCFILIYRLKFSPKAKAKRNRKVEQERKGKAEHVARVQARMNKTQSRR